MISNRIVIITGSPGSGKSTVAKHLAEDSVYDSAVHMHTDDFYRYICKGYKQTWLPEAQKQNIVVLEAFTAGACSYALGGYEVIVDGVIGPWFLDPWFKAVQEGFDVRFIVLRPDEKTTLARARERQGSGVLVNPEIIEKMRCYFTNLGRYEQYAIDTSQQKVEDSVANIRNILSEGGMRLNQLLTK